MRCTHDGCRHHWGVAVLAVWCLHGDNKSCRCLHGPSHSPSNDGIYIRFLWPSLCRLPVCVYFFPIKVTLGCTARSKMLPRLWKNPCMPSFSVSKPQDKINMLDEYIRGHDITLWYLLYRLETRMPQRVHNRTVFTNVDLYHRPSFGKIQTIFHYHARRQCYSVWLSQGHQANSVGVEWKQKLKYMLQCLHSRLSLNKFHSPDTPNFQKS